MAGALRDISFHLEELMKSSQRSPGSRLDGVYFLRQLGPLQDPLSGSHNNYLHSTYFQDSP